MISTAVCLAALAFKGVAAPVARAQGLDPNLVLAVVAVESSGNPRAFRYEPGYYARYMAKNPAFRQAAARYGVRNVSASLGLMQTMYASAYSVGYRGSPAGLYDPRTSLKVGSAYLARDVRRYGEWNGLRAYNAGVGGMLNGAGHAYASKVWSAREKLRRGCR